MRIHRNAQERGPGRSGRAGGLVMKGKAPEGPSIITQRTRLDDTEAPEGYTKCPECGRIIKDRADGTLRAHRSQGVIPCIAAQPRLGNTR